MTNREHVFNIMKTALFGKEKTQEAFDRLTNDERFKEMEKSYRKYDMGNSGSAPEWRPNGFETALLWIVAGLFAGFAFLAAAEVWFAIPEDTRRELVPTSLLSLAPYQEVDDICPAHWRLQAGYDDGNVQVDEDGFRVVSDQNAVGPPWLAVGDSCTFGVGEGWPSSLSEALGRQIVNGGVEGYAIRNMQCRLWDYWRAEPELTILYAGWNDLFKDAPQERVGAERLLVTGWQLARQRWWPRERVYEITRVSQYMPGFLSELEHLVDSLPGEVVLVTLPGLYSTDWPPAPSALSKGHLPYFTNNAYVFAAMTERYNEALRCLAEEQGLRVLDVARDWPHGEEDFFDSVHLWPEAQDRLGKWMAEELR